NVIRLDAATSSEHLQALEVKDFHTTDLGRGERTDGDVGPFRRVSITHLSRFVDSVAFTAHTSSNQDGYSVGERKLYGGPWCFSIAHNGESTCSHP
ncbi:hypothetical protein EDC04DRAFT_2569933, partial [Pisolithus marmoratus]